MSKVRGREVVWCRRSSRLLYSSSHLSIITITQVDEPGLHTLHIIQPGRMLMMTYLHQHYDEEVRLPHHTSPFNDKTDVDSLQYEYQMITIPLKFKYLS